MADGDGAAIDVDLGGIPAQLLVHGAGLGGESLIGLDQIQIGGFPAGLLQRQLGSGNGTGAHHLGIDAGLGPAGDAAQRGEAASGGILGAHQHQGGSAVIEARGIAGGDSAVLGESGLEAGHRFEGGAVADIFVGIDHRLTLAGLDRHGGDFILELAGLAGGLGLVLRGDGETVLVVAGDLEFLGDILGGGAHVIAVKGIPQAVADHGVDHGEIAHLLAGAQIRGMGGHAHGFLAARHHDAAVAIADRLGAQRHGTKARAADHVDAPGGGADGKAGGNGRLAGRVLALGGGEHLTQNHFANIGAIYLGALQRGADGDFAQLVGGHGCKSAAERPYRRTRRRNDDHIFHGNSPQPAGSRMYRKLPRMRALLWQQYYMFRNNGLYLCCAAFLCCVC